MNTTHVSVRWAAADDKPVIARLLHSLMAFTATLHGESGSSVKSVGDILIDLERTFAIPDKVRFVAAEVGGDVAGICCVETSYSTWHAKPYIVVNDVSVDPRFRRLGIGTRLLEFVTGHARNIGCCRVDLFVDESNLSAQKLYEKFGFDRLTQASYSIRIQPSEGVP